MDPSEATVLSDIDAHGWHMITVPADEHGPGFTYSIGLFKSYAHPEVIIFGLANELMQRVVGVVVELAKDGTVFRSEEETDAVLMDCPCVFRTVLRSHYETYLGYAMWYHRTVKLNDFPVLQCVWPDKARRFPWEPECEYAIRELQPSLYAA